MPEVVVTARRSGTISVLLIERPVPCLAIGVYLEISRFHFEWPPVRVRILIFLIDAGSSDRHHRLNNVFRLLCRFTRL